MRYKNLVFLGTSHIAKQSLDEVKRSIEDEKPQILALELDVKRINALMSKEHEKMGLKVIKNIGIKGFLFSLLGAWAEKKLGNIVGVAPGSEMRQAIRIARKDDIKIALIDQDIETTLKNFSDSITWREKVNFAADIVKAMFLKKERIEFDLTTVPDKKIIKKLTSRLKERYPNVYKVLIEERNVFIANKLKMLMDSESDKKILVILGAGHVDEVLELLKETA